MPSKKQRDDPGQGARFIEAGKKIGLDESGKKFERAFKKIMNAEKPKKAE